MYKPIVHYDRDMEAAVIGACLLEKNAFAEIRGLVTKDCFYFHEHQVIFEAMESMWEIAFPLDMLTVTSYLVRTNGIEEIGGLPVPLVILQVTKHVCNAANIQHHAFIIRQLYAERELLRIKNDKDGEGDILERTKKMQDELFKLTQIKVTNDWKDMSEVLIELYQHMDTVLDKDIVGIPTGFSDLDLITGGFVGGQMIILAARPSVGKSALLGAFCINAAQQGKKVAVISLEMSNTEIGARFGSLVSEVDFYKIFRNKFNEDRERDLVYEKMNQMAYYPIKISDKTNINVNDIRAKVSQLHNKEGIDILYIDYLQLLETEEKKTYNREQEVAKMSRGLKLLAKEFNIPVVVLAQLNRESEKLANKKPQLHHLRESGSIEQDADTVLFLHRDFKSGIPVNEHGQTTEFEADLIIAKCRNGELKEIKIGFDPSKMRFYDPYMERHRNFPPARNTEFDDVF
jgi:replicative DNA helicase